MVHVIGQIFPSSANTFHIGLTTEATFSTDLFRNPSDLGSEGVQLIHHGINGVFQLENFTARIHCDFL